MDVEAWIQPLGATRFSSGGGALARMLPVFRLGLGGELGSGAQLMSWIALSDVTRALLFALDHPSLTGPLNLTAPNPVTNAEFTRALARALSRPSFMRVPRFALRCCPPAVQSIPVLDRHAHRGQQRFRVNPVKSDARPITRDQGRPVGLDNAHARGQRFVQGDARPLMIGGQQ